PPTSTLFPYTTLFRSHGFEAVVLQRPHRVLAGGAGAEVGAGDQDRGALPLGAVEDEGLVLAPGLEQPVLETVPRDLLEPVSRDEDRKSTRLNSSHVSI